jgi:hypothetical protein
MGTLYPLPRRGATLIPQLLLWDTDPPGAGTLSETRQEPESEEESKDSNYCLD